MYLFAAALIAVSLGYTALAHSAAPKEDFERASATQNPTYILKTDHGDITIQLFADKAPISAKNFQQYADKGFYNGTIFHRVIPDFMIQGGGFTADMVEKKADKPIKNEASNGVSNKRGTLAMARTGEVDSATAQFFINVVDNPFLDYRGPSPSQYGYAVFGEVIDGMNIVDAIRKEPTSTKGGHQNVPTKQIVILEVVKGKSEK